jgi:hypothetical protein
VTVIGLAIADRHVYHFVPGITFWAFASQFNHPLGWAIPSLTTWNRGMHGPYADLPPGVRTRRKKTWNKGLASQPRLLIRLGIYCSASSGLPWGDRARQRWQYPDMPGRCSIYYALRTSHNIERYAVRRSIPKYRVGV